MSSSPPKTSSVTNASTTPVLPDRRREPELNDLADKLSRLGEGLVPDKLPGFEPLINQPLVKPDSFNIPFGAQETDLLEQAKQQTLGPRPGLAAANQYYSDEVSGKFLDPATNVGLQKQVSALGDTSAANLQRTIGETLSRAGQTGAGGGSRSALLQGQAIGEANRGLSEATGALLGKAYGQNRLLQSQAPGQLINTENMPVQNTLAGMELAGIPRQQAQAEQNARLQELSTQRDTQYQPLQIAQAILGQRLGSTIPIVAPGQNPMSGIAGLLSGLGSGAGGLSQLFGNMNSKTTSTGGGGGGGNWGLIGQLGSSLSELFGFGG